MGKRSGSESKEAEEEKSHPGWGEDELLKGWVKTDNGSLGKVKQSQKWRWAGSGPSGGK